MKIYKPIGSKERFLEMFQGVNKGLLNEVETNVVQTGTQLVEKAFDELRNKQANVKQTNTQTVDNYNFVEIVTNDQNGNEITFIFKVNSNEGDQDGVYDVGEASLTKFKIQSPTVNVEMPENMKAIQEFNAGHGSEIMSVVTEYADFETNTANIDDVSVEDNVYAEAVDLIDKIPYKKGSEEIQTHHAYADNKPTNPKLRVSSDELQKFVSEMEDFIVGAEADDDILTKTPEDIMAESTDQDRYEDVVFMQGEEADEPLEILNDQGQDAALQYLMQWHDTGNHMGSAELGHGSGDQTYEKDGYIMSWNFPLNYIGLQYDLSNMDEVKEPSNPPEHAFQKKYGNNWEQERKKFLDKNTMTDDDWKEEDDQIKALTGSVDETEKNDYPDQIGKKFKPKNQMPKKKKKPQSVVKLGEESEIPQEYWGSPEDEMDESIDVNENDFEEIDTENYHDQIEGGLADNKKPQDFDSEQLAMGLKVEMEHTDDPMIAIEIAMDHLTEMPNYYSELDKMENGECGADEGLNDITPEDEEETDELLGYKPHNVNDYATEGYEHIPSTNEGEYWNKEEIIDETELSDFVDTQGRTEIWYMKSEHFRDFIHGYDDVERFSPEKIPTANNLENTHALLGTIAETDPEQIFHKLNNWGGSDVNEFLKGKGVSHTSMSVGDIIKLGNKALMVDRTGFKELSTGEPDNVDTTGGVSFGNQSVSEIDVVDGGDNGEYQGEVGDRYRDAGNNNYTVRDKDDNKGNMILQGHEGESKIAPNDVRYLERLSEAKAVLKNRSNKMSKKEAVHILMLHNIKK